MRILITGGAGHIGSRLAQHVIGLNHDVVVLDDLSCGYRENVPADAQLVHARADDQSVINDLGPYDVVYHLAAYAAECMSPFVRRFNYENNVVQTAGLVSNLIDAEFRGRLVFASSIAVYGKCCKPPFRESMHCSPNDPYGVAKMACEQDIRVAGEQHGLDWCVVRPHNVYGPGQSLWQPYRGVVALWMRSILEERPVTIFGDGEQRRALTYVEDVLPALWAAGTLPEASGEVFNVGAGRPYSLNDLYLTLCDATMADVSRGVGRDYEPERHELRDAFCEGRKAKEVLGYEDRTSLLDGLCKTWEWAKQAWQQFPERRAPVALEPETLVGMPPKWRRERLETGVQASTID